MDFSFTEDQDALRELTRKILGDLATPERIGAIEKSEEWFDRELWAELGKANLLGVGLPETQGGSGWGFFEVCLLLQEQGRAGRRVRTLSAGRSAARRPAKTLSASRA